MATANDIIKGALRLLKVKEAGETLDGNEAADGLVSLNDLLDSWSNERWMQTQITEVTHTLVGSTGSYTIGSGGDISTTWPVKIQSAFIRDSSNNDYSLSPITDEQYARIGDKTTESSIPRTYYYKRAYPLGTIYLFQVPSTAYTLHLRVWPQWTAFAAGSTTVSLPPGYKRALIYNLAVEISPEYQDASQMVMKTAIESKSYIKRVNSVPPVMRSDARFIPGKRNRYDVVSGDYI